MKGPLNPGPKPSDRRSYARRLCSDSGLFPASDEPNLMSSAGAASSKRAPVATTADKIALRWTKPENRCQTLVVWLSPFA